MSVPRSACVLVVALALSACGMSKPEVARVGDQDIEDVDLRQAVALQQVLADLQGAPCGGETAAGEAEGAACNRIAQVRQVAQQKCSSCVVEYKAAVCQPTSGG